MQVKTLALALGLMLAAGPAVAGLIDRGRAALAGGQFAQALDILAPAARSGNAEAEEMIGQIHALGLGVPADPRRAVEWFHRAAQRGHPGAMAALAGFYETGRGLAGPDRVRAYVWFALSALGGEPDAARDRDRLAEMLTEEEIENAHTLISDYKPMLYPFR